MVHNVNFAAEGNQLNFKFVRPYLVSIGGGTFSGKGGHPESETNRLNFQDSNYLALWIHPT